MLEHCVCNPKALDENIWIIHIQLNTIIYFFEESYHLKFYHGETLLSDFQNITTTRH